MFKNKGFTLIELLVVILIIGILAAVALPQYQKAVDKAQYINLIDITRVIEEANERYYMVHNTYSTRFDQLDIDIPANSFSGTYAYFDWGYCNLGGQLEIVCLNNKPLQVMYIKGYKFSNRAGWNSSYCLAEENNIRNNNLCKNIGGKFKGVYTCYFGTCNVYQI